MPCLLNDVHVPRGKETARDYFVFDSFIAMPVSPQNLIAFITQLLFQHNLRKRCHDEDASVGFLFLESEITH
jgi:hypothetical protein